MEDKKKVDEDNKEFLVENSNKDNLRERDTLVDEGGNHILAAGEEGLMISLLEMALDERRRKIVNGIAG